MLRAVQGKARSSSSAALVAVVVGASTLTTGVIAEHRFSNVNDIADSYITVMLASQKIMNNEGAARDFKPSLLRAVSALDSRVGWSLQKHKIFEINANGDDACYRLEWMKAHLRGLMFQLLNKEKRVSFDDESLQVYDTHVEKAYLDPALTSQAHAQLETLLPPSSARKQQQPIHVRHAQYQSRIMIPKHKYESVFRQLFDDVLEKCENLIPELQSATVTQQYIDDAKNSVEAYVEPDHDDASSTRNVEKGGGLSCKSKMVVNIARAVSYDKAQQLAVHELTHHFQNVLMEQHLYDTCPEMRVALDVMGPMGIVLEGGAEAMVELYFNQDAGGVVDRVQDLEQRMPAAAARNHRNQISPRKILDIERITWFGLWPTIVQIARDFQNGDIDKDECQKRMLEQSLKRDDSWPNADFFEEVGAYTLGYGYGKELILRYCFQQAASKKNTTPLHEYIRLMKRPLLPSQMQRELSS